MDHRFWGRRKPSLGTCSFCIPPQREPGDSRLLRAWKILVGSLWRRSRVQGRTAKSSPAGFSQGGLRVVSLSHGLLPGFPLRFAGVFTVFPGFSPGNQGVPRVSPSVSPGCSQSFSGVVSGSFQFFSASHGMSRTHALSASSWRVTR